MRKGVLFNIHHWKNCWSIRYFVLLPLLAVSASSNTGDQQLQTHRETACENYRISLRCPGNDLIRVKIASYGRNDDRTCISESAGNTDTRCGLHLYTAAVSGRCDGKSDCSFVVDSSSLPDPCPATKKYLQVLWECLPFVASCPSALKQVTKNSSSFTKLDNNGAWARDPFQQTTKIFYRGWSKYRAPQLREFHSVDALKAGESARFHRIPDRVDGTGYVVYDGSFYYNKERSRTVVRYDLMSKTVIRREIPKANYHGTSPYAVGMDTDIDLAVDENGLWVIYATEANTGRIVLSRLETKSLKILGTWTTTYPKISALNAFVVCGVLYVVNNDSRTIDYMFNTSSGVGSEINKVIPGLSHHASSIDYNPKDQMLYVWDTGSAITYKLTFEKPGSGTKAPTTPPTTTSPPSPIRPTTKPIKTTKNPLSPAVPTAQSTTTRNSNTEDENRWCEGREAKGLVWEDTKFSDMAFLPCPGVGEGQAIWLCGGNSTNPSWTTEPDLTQCASRWINDLGKEINVGRLGVSELSIKLLASLQQYQNDLTSWDISVIISTLRKLLRLAENEPRNAAALTSAVIKCGSILLSANVSDAWVALTQPLKTHLAAELMDVVEDTSFFLGKDIMSDYRDSDESEALQQQNQFAVQWSEPHIALSLKVVPVLPNTRDSQNDVEWRSGGGDVVTLDSKAILEAANDGAAKILAFLSFENLGTYMSTASGLGSEDYPANSDVVLVSAASATAQAFRRIEHPLQLKRPLVVSFQHRKSDFPYSSCAFWNKQHRDGDWSASGCRRLSGNQTHSVCQCDHMTAFAVVSTLSPPTDGPQVVGPISDDVPLNYLNVARSGVAISFVILLVVLLTLICNRKTLDINAIHKNLVLSLCFTELVFMFGIHQIAVPNVCMAVGILLHFGVLCVFTWHVLEAAHIFMVLGDPLERNDRWRWYYVSGYTCPGLVVAVSCAVDYKAYGGFLVCWLRNDNGFVWSLVAPCCFAVCLCVVLLALSYRKMRANQLHMTERCRNTRSHAARTGLLLFLIVAMMTCGLLWFSNLSPQYTSALFCIFASGHGVVTFIFYCLIPSEIRQMYSNCMPARKTLGSGRYSGQGLDHSMEYPDSNTMRSNLRCDGTTRTIYHYQTGTHATASTAMMPTANFRSMRYAKAAVAMESEALSLNSMHSRDNTFQQFPECECLIGASGAGSNVDDTDPKLPATAANRLRAATLNQYHFTARGSHPNSNHACSRGGGEQTLPCPGTAINQYEQPTHYYCQCTHSSAASGCYDHLHEESYHRGHHHCATGAHLHYSPGLAHPTAATQPRGNPQRAPHHYETLAPILGEDQEFHQLQDAPVSMQRRHCYEDVSVQRVHVSNQRPRPLSNHSMNDLGPQHSAPRRYKQNSSSTDNLCYRTSLVQGSSGGQPVDPRYRRQQFHPDQKQTESSPENYSRSGRHSDPLSTDQGYDTDSQMPAHHSQQMHAQRNSRDLAKPHFTSLVVRTSGSPSAVNSDSNQAQMVRTVSSSSSSAKSDCPSENDREVELIIGSPDARVDEPNQQSYSGGLDPKTNLRQREVMNDSYTEGIDTEVGGCVSACGTVASWSAVTSSDMRLAGSPNAKNLRNPILSRGGSEHSNAANGPRKVDYPNPNEPCRNGDNFTYTLPGTAQAGTKARIDLKSGGISMITNL